MEKYKSELNQLKKKQEKLLYQRLRSRLQKLEDLNEKLDLFHHIIDDYTIRIEEEKLYILDAHGLSGYESSWRRHNPYNILSCFEMHGKKTKAMEGLYIEISSTQTKN